jgi:poly(3-hydroxybutyrate) depolymerase
MLARLLVAALFGLPALGCMPMDRAAGGPAGAPAAKVETGGPIETPGFREHRLAAGDGRPFWVYFPAGRAADERLPLVFSIHGRNGTGFSESLRWHRPADKHRFIVCCPNSAGSNSGRTPDYGVDQENYLLMLEEVMSRYPVDRSRVLITGFSGGALSAFWTAVHHPRRFAGLAVRSPSWPHTLARQTAALRAARGLPVFIVHGQKDHTFTLEDVRDAARTFRAAGWEDRNLTVMSIPDGGHDGSAGLPAILEWFADRRAGPR